MQINQHFHKIFYRPISVIYFFFFITALFSSKLFSQNIPIGTWRTHAAYNNVLSIAISPDKVYAGTSGGLFYFDKQYNNAAPITKLDGLSETDVKKVNYDIKSQTLIIIYGDGNIDLLQNNKIKNLNLIQQSNAIQNKNINQINILNNIAYLAFDFGLVVLDIQKQEIKETWLNLGTNGAKISIYGSAFIGDSVFLATSQGVITSSQSKNLQDFNSWKVSSSGLPIASPVKAINTDGNYVYAGIENKGLYKYKTGKWNKIILQDSIYQINNIEFTANQLLISLPKKIIKYSNGMINKIENASLPNPQAAMFDTDNKLWVGDAINGLFTLNGNEIKSILPNGPFRKQVFQLYNYDEKIIALSGGYFINGISNKDSAGYYIFSQNTWKNYNNNEINSDQHIPLLYDFVSAAYNPKDKNLYLGSFGNGVLISKPNGKFSVFDQNNSPLPAQTKITSATTDADGNVWFTNAGVNFGDPSLYVYQSNNTWKSFQFANPYALFPTQLIIDQNNFKWMTLLPSQGQGIWVYDDKKNRGRLLTKNVGEGNLPTSNVYSIAMDLDGAIWVGTSKGVAVFYNATQIFDKINTDALQPIFDQRPLLREEVVNSIAIDGGNRKWMGTKNGLWLFNPDGTQLISHFNSQNAPLPSDNIISIVIEPVTGEVFVATDKGIVSYRGTATLSDGTNNNVKIFPNPVRPGFEGLIGISGLATNAIVKITDVSGRLVFQTKANGGTAIWDAKDYKGRRVNSGIYIIFSSSAEGTEGYVGKIAIVE